MKLTGVEQIAAERQRQLEVEGFTADRDASYNADELSRAAVAYACHDTFGLPPAMPLWPWEASTFKPSPREPHDGYWTARNIAARTSDLVKAGALIAAEIDRLGRLS